MFLRKHKKDLSVEKLSTAYFPIWIKIWNIPLDLFSVEGISCIDSGVRDPISL